MNETKYIQKLTHFDPDLALHDIHTGNCAAILTRHCPMLQEIYPQLTIQELCDAMHAAGCLHDIGKTMIAHSVLAEEGQLSRAEMEVMRVHPKRAIEIIRQDPDFQKEQPVVRRIIENACLYHHERYDGSGYPMGLSADLIPIEAYLISLSDVLDALLSKRPYKTPWTLNQAVDFILSKENEAFSSDAIACFRDSLDEITQFYTAQQHAMQA